MANVKIGNKIYTGITTLRIPLANRNDYAVFSLSDDPSQIDLSSIVEYYHEEVQQAYDYVCGLGTDDWVHHVILTDTHYSHNAGNSVVICNLLMGTDLFDKFIFLGDIVETPSAGNWQLALDKGIANHADKMLFCIGNHDDEGTEVTNQTYYDALVAPNADLVMGSDDVTKLYYHCDDTARKIRYIVLNSMIATDTEMKTWFDERIGELDEDWTYFVLEHYPAYKFISDTPVGCADTYLKIDSILARAKCGGHIAGHTHRDFCGNNEFYNQQTYLMDRLLFSETDFPDGTTSTREQGTASEHAITILSINPNSKDVRSYRIGAHDDGYQLMTYNYGALCDDKTPVANYYLHANAPGGFVYATDAILRLSKNIYTADSEDLSNDCYWMYRNDFSTMPCDTVYISGYLERKASSWIARNKIDFKDSRIAKAFGYTTLLKRSKNQATAKYMIMAFIAHDDTGLENCTITKEPYAPHIPYSSDLWESGFISSNTIVDDTEGIAYVTKRAFSCKPNTKYKIYNTDADWSMTYIRANQYSAYNPDSAFFITTHPSGTISAKEYTFTTKANANYIILAFKTNGDPKLGTVVFEELTE